MENVQTRPAAIAASEIMLPPAIAENIYSIAAATKSTAHVYEEHSIAATTAKGFSATAEGISSVAAATSSQARASIEQIGSVAAVTGRGSLAEVGSTGEGSVAVATGEGAEARAVFNTTAVTTGVTAVATGKWGLAMAVGRGSLAIARGEAKALALGGGIAVTTGLAAGTDGSILIFVRPDNFEYHTPPLSSYTYTPACVRTVVVGQDGIEPYTAYWLNEAGEVEEAPLELWDPHISFPKY